MIDDYNDQFAPPVPNEDKPVSKSVSLIVGLIAFIIYAGVWTIISLPKIEKSLKETRFSEIVGNIDKYREQADSKMNSLFFADIEGKLVEIVSPVPVSGNSEYHDVIECLLKGPSENALKKGAVSFIPQGTKLNGLSVSNGYAFVDLSAEFMSTEFEWNPNAGAIAEMQILRTLNGINKDIKALVLLIDGVELH